MLARMRTRLRKTVLLITLALGACSEPEDRSAVLGQVDYGGHVERIEALGDYSAEEAALLLQLAGANASFSVRTGFSLQRVVYRTTGVRGEPTLVSGLVAVPASGAIKGVVSWQHGTNSFRPNSISQPSVPEGVGVAALFASDGYLLVAPDYIGLGVSHDVHPYYHWPSTVETTTDLLSIAARILPALSRAPAFDVYLAGFSQGGGATAALQRTLEADNPTPLRVRAAATLAAAFDPAGISLANAIETDNPFFLAMIVNALAFVHERPLEDVIQAPYARQLPALFDGTHGQADILAHLPPHLTGLLTERFLRDFTQGVREPAWFYDALEAARTDDYAPQAPLRICFGTRDTIVVPAEAKNAFERMRDAGGRVELHDVGPFTHDDLVVNTLPSVQRWFDELQRSAP